MAPFFVSAAICRVVWCCGWRVPTLATVHVVAALVVPAGCQSVS